MLSNTPQTQNEDNDIPASQWQLMLNVFESQWNDIITKPITASTNHHVNGAVSCQDKCLQGIINKLIQSVAHIKNNHLKYYNGSNNMFDEFTSKKIAELELMKPSKRQNIKHVQCNNVNSGVGVGVKQQRTFLKQNDNDNNDYQSNCNKVTIDDLIIQQQQQMKPKQKLQHVFESVGETIPSGVFSNNSSKRNGGVKKKRHLFLSNDNNNNNNNNINCNNNHNKYNNSISNLNTQQHNRHKSFLKEDEPKIVKKKKTMAADKIGLHPLNTTTTTNHPPIIKTTTTTTNIKHRLITHTSPNNTGSKSERSSKIRKKIQHNTQLISEMMKLNNK
jgi:hypothetical protein